MKNRFILLQLFGFLALVIIVSLNAPLPALAPSPPVLPNIEFSIVPHSLNTIELVHPSVLKAQIGQPQDVPPVAEKTFWDIIKDNWGALLMAFLALLEIIIRATPSVSDNSIFNLIKKILDALIPNKSADGGVFP